MISKNVLYSDIPNAVSYEAVFGKTSNFKFLVSVGLVGHVAECVNLRGDDAKQSSSEVTGENNTNSQAWEMESDITCPPMCKALPSGKIMNVPDTESIFTGDTRHQVDLLLDQNDADLDVAPTYKGDSLLMATEMADVQAVQRIVEKNSTASVNMSDENDKTALHIASEQGLEEIAQKLLAHEKIEPSKEDKQNQTALFIACGQNHLRVAELLLQHPKIDSRDVNYCFFRYSCFGNVEVVNLVLPHPVVDINWAREKDGLTPLVGVCQAGSLEIVEKLLERNEIEVNKARTDDGATPLHMASQNGHLEVVEKLLERNEIEVNKAGTDIGATPLFVACQQGHLEIVEKLLERKEIEVNKARTDIGGTPLYIACQQGHLEVVEKLLERKEIEVNTAKTDDGATPLFMACQQGHLEIVEKLLERNEIEVNKATTDDGTAPLFMACLNGHLEVVEKLLKRNEIDASTETHSGNTALTIATQQGHDSIVKLLTEHSTKN